MGAWLDTLRRWLPLAIVAGCLALGLALAHALTAGRDARDELAREREAHALTKAGFAVAERDRAQLRADRDRILSQYDLLAAEAERLRKASPGARVVGAIELDTGTVTASGPASPKPPPSAPAAAPAPVTAGCLLWPGDGTWITVALLPHETAAGNLVFPWQAKAGRVDPAGRVQLFTGSGRASVSWEPPEAKPGWAFGLAGGLGGRGGAVYGLAASPPPWGHLELVGAGAANARGDWQATAAVLWRMR